MTTLVTGGAGFIGSALCHHLIAQTDERVIVLDKLTYAASSASLDALQRDDRFEFVRGDICDRELVETLLARHGVDRIAHLAAETHVDRSIDGAATFVQTNIVGTQVLLDATLSHWQAMAADRRDRFRFVHVSTDEVFGSLGPAGAFSETTAYDPSSPYSASKAASDHLVRAWHRTYGLPTLVTNCSNNYGPRQFPEKLIPLMILKCVAGEPLPVYGDGLNVRDWLHVEDHACALALVAERGVPGETYAIGGGAEKTNLDVVRGICAAVDAHTDPARDSASLMIFVADRPGHDRRYAIDASKLKRELGFAPRHTFDDGLAATVDWYLQNEAWWRPLQARVYEGQRLGVVKAGAASA